MALNDLKLTFRDEFNSLSLDTGTKATDPNLWNSSMHNGYVRSLSGNKELQIYMDPDYKGLGVNPFSTTNGVLTIKAAPASSTVKNATGYGYTSGALTTQNEFSQKYGYFEVRAQVPEGKGLWPAFWLLADHEDWPPELDVMEVIGSETHKLHQTIHSDHGNKGHTTYINGKLSDGYHTYGMDWTKSHITFYLEGKQTATMATPADMHSSMYLLLNLAVGGKWPGSPNSSTDWANAKYNIDYVRVYQHTGIAGSGGVLGIDGGTNPPSIPAPVPATPKPPAAHPAPATPAVLSGLVLSHGSDVTGASGKKFAAADTGANSAKTYGAGQLGLGGAATSSVSVSFDGDQDLKAVHKGAWNGVKNAAYVSAKAKEATLENFVGVHVSLTGGRDAAVSVKDAKRGTIFTGSGADKIAVTGKSNGWSDNTLTIDSGDGADVIGYTGENDNRVVVRAGNGNDIVTISGAAAGSANGGAGDDRFVIRGGGALSLTGGDGADSYELTAASRVTISDFKLGQDRLSVGGVTASAIQVRRANGNSYVEVKGAKLATLTGVSLTSADLGFTIGSGATPNVPPAAHATHIPTFDSRTAMPGSLLAPDSVFKDWPQAHVKFSNTDAVSVLDGSTFTARKTGAGTSTTYSDRDMRKIHASSSATVSYDSAQNLTVTNNGGTSGVKNVAVRSSSMSDATVRNFMGADIDMSGNGSIHVKIEGVTYGSIATGSAADKIEVVGRNGSGKTSDLMTISAGNGANKVSYSGGANNRAAIIAGSGNDTVVFSGEANGAINAGAGNDRIDIRSTGNVAVTGGAGADVFSFIAGAHATIADFKAGEDRLEFSGVGASNVQVRNNGVSTVIDLNGQSAVVLSGVALSASQLNIGYV